MSATPSSSASSSLPVLLVCLAVLSFAFTLRTLGLVIASILLVVISGASAADRRWTEILIIAVVFAGVAGALFVYGLGLQAPLFPGR